MTLQPREEIDLTFVDESLPTRARSKEAAIPILQAIQAHYRYLPGRSPGACLRTDRNHARADLGHLVLLFAISPLAGW